MNRSRPMPTALALALLIMLVSAPLATGQEDRPGVGLRIALDRVLAEHAFLLIDVMRTGVDGGAEYTAAAEALEFNTADFINAIAGIYGPAAADAVEEQWHNHHAYLVDYARALANNDSDAAELADSQLNQYVSEFSALLSSAIPTLPENAVSGLLAEHVQQLEQVAAIAGGEFAEAYPSIRQTYEHMFTVGDGLAGAITRQFPDRFGDEALSFNPAIDLRLTLDRLLGEHTQLAALAMQTALSGAADASSAADALDANSAALEEAIGTIFGSQAGAAFGRSWRSHTAVYLDYVAALKDGDDQAKSAAEADLERYSVDFTAFLSSAIPLLPTDAFERQIHHHTGHLIALADTYEAGTYTATYVIRHDAYAQSGEIAAQLASAISDQFPTLFPDTAMAERLSTPTTLIVIGQIAVVAALAVMVRRRRAARLLAAAGPRQA